MARGLAWGSRGDCTARRFPGWSAAAGLLAAALVLGLLGLAPIRAVAQAASGGDSRPAQAAPASTPGAAGLAPESARSDPLPVPALQARVTDRAGLLDPQQAAALEARLAALEAQRGSQVVVLLVPSTQPEDIAAFAQRVGDAWKLGRREVGDGLLIVVAVQDRRVNLQVAKALEGAVPDLAARQIIDRVITPAFRTGDYAGGLMRAVEALDARIGGEGLPEPDRRAPSGSGSGIESLESLLVLFVMIVPLLGSVLVRTLGRRLGALTAGVTGGALAGWLTASLLIGGAAAVLATVLVGLFGGGTVGGRSAGRRGRGGSVVWGGGLGSGSGSFGGGWSGGGGGGGFGGFGSGGGGDFGGGGASGSW